MPKRTKKTNVTPIKKQGELAGLEKPNHPELDLLMEKHASTSADLGTARQALGEINEQLLATAEKLRVDTYRHPTAVPELLLTIKKGTPKVKVKQAESDVDVDEASDE